MKKAVRDLERHNIRLKESLRAAELRVAEQAKIIEEIYEDDEDEEEEIWADVIEDR